MKNKILLIFVSFTLTSCSFYQYTSRQINVEKQDIILSPTIVDVKVDYSKRVNETSKRCKTQQEAMEEARYLAVTNNQIDIVVDPIVKVERRLRRYQVTLTGFAGYYVNSRSLYDDIRQTKDLSREDIKKYFMIHRPETLRYMNEKGEVVNIYHNEGSEKK